MQITKSLLAAVLMLGPTVLAAPADIVSHYPILMLGDRGRSLASCNPLCISYSFVSMRDYPASTDGALAHLERRSARRA